MFEALKQQPADKIIELIGLYAADPREDKVDLGVGVYKNAEGKTPVMHAVKAAEQRLLETQETKSYLGLTGDAEFVDAMADMIFGPEIPRDRLCGAQTPGGTGAIRQLFELTRLANPEAVVWISDPTWPNHPAILNYLGIPMRTYRYFDPATLEVDFAGMLADLDGMKRGDVVLLHGCCHNPTGANLDHEQWRVITDLVNRRGAVPMIDLAYQGFGDGLEQDAAGLRYMAANVPEMMLAASCSKSFGLYRDRVGVAFTLTSASNLQEVARGNLAALNRMNYSFPPDHGAKVVSIILNDEALRADWMAEIEGMRLRMLDLRNNMAEALRRETNSDRFDFIARHRGMFSRLGMTPAQVQALRDDHGIYMVGDSRINIAGLPGSRLDHLAKAVAAVSG